LLEQPIDAVGVSAYLKLDDNLTNACISGWQDDQDPILSDLCRRFLHRNLFMSIELNPSRTTGAPEYASALAELQEEFKKTLDPRYYLAPDSAQDMPYKDLVWFLEKNKASEEIWVSQDGKGRQRLSEISPLIQSISNTPIVTRRLCFPKELYALVLKHLESYVTA
jgi:HD superfamily phosphohydrolase